MAKFDIKTVKPKFVVTTSPENKIDVVVNKPIIETKLSKSFFKLKNTGGPKGDKGDKGEPGQDGQSATIEVASTSTLPAGSSATVTNVGTSSAARLVFGIPKGDTGAAGVDGDAATITVGQVETLQPNQSAYVTNVGTSEAAIFNIGIPKGDKGDSGAGSGDMTASVYDPNGTVAAAGGIPGYVAGELPTVNDATLTIQKNGTTINTFTANSASNVTANITVPTDTSDLTNGAGYITSSALPTVNDATLTITQNGVTAGTFTANASSNNTIALTDTTYSDFTGATSLAAGAAGLVPAPTTSDPDKFLKGDGTWATVQAGSSGLVLYANNSLHTPDSITGIYADSGLTTMAGTSDMIATIDDGGSVVIKYGTDEAVALTSYDDHASSSPSTISFTGQFLSNWKTNSPEFIKFIYNSVTSTWSAEGASLPTKTSDLTNDGSDGTSTYVEADELAAVATSGSYNDLSNTPTIPAAQVNSDWNAASGVAQILNKPSLATVATTGAYSDLSGKPTIPTVNNATLTIQKNGTNVATFTANASSNVTANISVPTQLSNLSGTVSSSQIADKAVTIAKLADLSYGTGTINSTYFSSGRVQWVKHARMVTVTMSDLALKTTPPNSTNSTNAISGLPTSASWKQNDVINLTRYGGTTVPLTLRMDGNKTALTFHYTSGAQNGTYEGQFTYPAA